MSGRSIDLNADLGEGFPYDDALLRVVTSANIACGGHAGDRDSMRRTLLTAASNGVRLGAHPSYPDRENFGRKPVVLSTAELAASLTSQVAALHEEASQLGLQLSYLKPHGALYHEAARHPHTTGAVVAGVAAEFRLALLWAPAVRAPTGSPIECYGEGFADRRYLPDGSLAGRGLAGAVLTDPRQVARQALRLALRQNLLVGAGGTLHLDVDSICVHGDTPGALKLALAVRDALRAHDVVAKSFLA